MSKITAHMAGVVLEFKVKKGDRVGTGQEVAVLEAMKMQMPVVASAEGTVTNLLVTPGSFVNEGDGLVELS